MADDYTNDATTTGTLGGTAESNLSLVMRAANGASVGSSARTNSAVGDPVLTLTPLASGT